MMVLALVAVRPAGAEDRSLGRDGLKIDIFCAAARTHNVPVDLLRAVWLVENTTIGIKDSFQTALFELMTANLTEIWWNRWWQQLQSATTRSHETFVRQGKWAIDVIQLGGVFSIGPAQITPLTALRACEHDRIEGKECSTSVRELLASMLTLPGSIDAAARVLGYERQFHRQEAGEDIASNWEEWATLYNFGGPRFRNYYAARGGQRVNTFAAQARAIWEKAVTCP